MLEGRTEPPAAELERILRIFLNYRREDASGHAGRLYDDLADRFGEDRIFMDIDKIEPGLDFGESIERALGNCDVVLAVIGRHWLTVADADGRRRIDNPDDYVRLELEAAIERGVRLIPVRVQGTDMPSSTELPETLKALARRQAIELSDNRWRYDVDVLASALQRLASETAEREERERLAREQEERDRAAEEDAERRRRAAEEEAERERVEREAEQKAVREREEYEREAERDAERRGVAAEARRIAEERAARETETRDASDAAGAGVEIVDRGPPQPAPGDSSLAPVRESLPPSGRLREAGRPALVAGVGAAALLVVGLGLFVLLGGDDGRQATRPGADVLPPASVTAPAIAGTARAGSVLEAARGTWKNAPSRFEYEWRRCSVEGLACQAIVGATSARYRPGDRDVGRRLRVQITASNKNGTETRLSKPTVVIGPPLAPPANAARPTLSGTAQEDRVLRARPGAWRGTRPFAFSFVWKRCNAQGGECEPIGAQRGSTYTLRRGDVGHTVLIEVRASNRDGRTATTSRPTPVVQAAPEVEPPPAPQPTTPPPTPAPQCPPDCVRP